MKHVIIGTAGHVDHGKTTLIKALTGTDTDRLKEEQERGMTIDLGFAALALPNGTKAGIVDVPGHERFLKNMLAGAGGVDVVLLVIAADESVMPQTVEHLDILRLLDVRNGVVALTKLDMVDPEWLAVVEDDVRGHLAGSFLADSPVIPVDSISGKGIADLKKALFEAVARAETRNAALPFRLPVDRVFTRPGFGTVVTGTLVAGTMRVGDAVEILPQKRATRIRGLQSHGKKQEAVEAGTRVAVNLAGVEIGDLERGALLSPPRTLEPTQIFDATLRLLPTAPRALKNRTRIRVYLGTAEILGRVQILGQETLEPPATHGPGVETPGYGRSSLRDYSAPTPNTQHPTPGTGFIQFRAETPFACARGDRFVVRTYSPMITIGGGIVLDIAPTRHKRMDPAVIHRLEAKERGAPDDLLSAWLQQLPFGVARKEAAKPLGLTDSEVTQATQTLIQSGEAIALDGDRLIHRANLAAATDRAVGALSAYHAAHPLRPGMPREELRGGLGKPADPRAFAALLAHWVADGAIAADAATVRSTQFHVQLNPAQQALMDRIIAIYKTAGFNAPSTEEAAAQTAATPDAVTVLTRVAQDQGVLVRIAEGLYFHAGTVSDARRIVAEHIRNVGGITVSTFRDLTGSSRKYALPMMEYLDSICFTRRLGDERVLVE